MSIYDEQLAHGRSGTRKGWLAQERTYRWFALCANRLALENTLIGSAVAGVAPPFIPRCNQVAWTEEVVPGIAALIAHFESVPWPGEAYVTIHPDSYGEKFTHDLDGKLMDTTELEEGGSTDNLYEWRVVRGERVRSGVRLVAVIHTSFYASSPAGFLAGANCVNGTGMPRLSAFANVPNAIGTWMLVGSLLKPRFTPMAAQTDLVFHDYPFAYEARGWNNLTLAQRFSKVTRKVPVYDEDMQPVVGQYREVTDLAPVEWDSIGMKWKPTLPEPRRTHALFNFSGLDSCIQ